mgnify:CR=1 FL=1
MADYKFPLEKILTITPSEFCSSKGKELKDYEMRGVHVDDDLEYAAPLISRFQEKVPSNAEVVVSFQYAVCGAKAGGALLGFSNLTLQYASGTALIPKSE